MNMNSYKCCQPNTSKFKQVSDLSHLLKLVGEENRLKLLCLLQQGEHCVCEILEHYNISQSLASHHLSDLKKAGLITNRKDGRQVFYSLTKKGQKLTNSIFSL
ncbi:MAG: metalloregulator ArsR/SmtB family transcription factor [Candidatus Pacebacteria bacterium]|nr:metalloregulator ArsR/SmtB family transcription factor [Candidatus Paceibacterota bacterium]